MHSYDGAQTWKLHQFGSPACTAQMLTPAEARRRQGQVPLMMAACMAGRRMVSRRRVAGDWNFIVGGVNCEGCV